MAKEQYKTITMYRLSNARLYESIESGTAYYILTYITSEKFVEVRKTIRVHVGEEIKINLTSEQIAEISR